MDQNIAEERPETVVVAARSHDFASNRRVQRWALGALILAALVWIAVAIITLIKPTWYDPERGIGDFDVWLALSEWHSWLLLFAPSLTVGAVVLFAIGRVPAAPMPDGKTRKDRIAVGALTALAALAALSWIAFPVLEAAEDYAFYSGWRFRLAGMYEFLLALGSASTVSVLLMLALGRGILPVRQVVIVASPVRSGPTWHMDVLKIGSVFAWVFAVILGILVAVETNDSRPDIEKLAGLSAWADIFFVIAIATTVGSIVLHGVAHVLQQYKAIR